MSPGKTSVSMEASLSLFLAIFLVDLALNLEGRSASVAQRVTSRRPGTAAKHPCRCAGRYHLSTFLVASRRHQPHLLPGNTTWQPPGAVPAFWPPAQQVEPGDYYRAWVIIRGSNTTPMTTARSSTDSTGVIFDWHSPGNSEIVSCPECSGLSAGAGHVDASATSVTTISEAA